MKAAAAALAVLALWATVASAGDCRDDRADLKGDFGTVRFTVEIADELDEQMRGLMHRESLGRFDGMLFVYPVPGRARFWMKNTLIPLDMIFLDPTGRITRIHKNAEPLSLDSIDGGDGVKAVLEINGGMAAELGLAPGDVLRHPRFDQERAAWPCS